MTDGNEERRVRHKKKVTRNVAEPTVQLMDGQSVPEKEMDAGLLNARALIMRGEGVQQITLIGFNFIRLNISGD